MAGSILGNRVRRTEDPELLTRGGTYVYDLELDGVLHCVFVRSIVAHATITNIDTEEAAAAPGVVAVLTADELGVAAHHGFVKVANEFAHTPLAADRVRFVGEPVAMVLAETFAEAIDAAELVIADYEPLPVIVDPERAFDSEAPIVFPDKGDNIALSVVDPDTDVLAGADHIVRGRYVNQRVAGAPMEPNSCAAVPGDGTDGPDGRLTFYAANQMPHMLQGQMARALKMEAEQIRVITPHVGGGFGAKAGICPENSAVAAAAMKVGRPVTWTETRSENMVAMVHSRAQVQYCELGVTTDGTFTGLRVRLIGDAGAYPNVGAMLPGGTKRMSNGTYTFPQIRFDVAVGITNTTPTGAYRGAGRPEAAALLERLVDQAAIELGMDPLEIRRKNFITPDAFPFKTLTGITYDTGDYAAALDHAAELANYTEMRAEQQRRRAAGERKQLGIGVASFVEVTSGGGGSEYAAVTVNPDGTATVRAGTSAHGQGHQTTYAMLVSEQTGIPVEDVRLVQSDTDLVRSGGGTGGSRSIQLGGSAVKEATEAVVAKARNLAAHLLEADPNDIVVDTDAATVGVAGVPARALSWADLASRAAEAPDGVIDNSDADGLDDIGLVAQLDFKQDDGTFPFGTHISVVEVDLDTGQVEMLRHVAVDDAGTVVNELLFEGQQQGGVGQGLSQALYEEVAYDDDGNPITANLMDYAFPSAAEMCSFDVAHTVTPTTLNPLGVKGIGEASTIGSTPAVQNAVIDAVSHLGVRHIDMPCTSRRVWEAIDAAQRGEPADPWREPPAIFDQLVAAASAKGDDGAAAAEAAADAAESI
ncbi:MAG: xanthine dehydrogenase family protein molybdopterin-binding subunit [Actinomycetota bacterium]